MKRREFLNYLGSAGLLAMAPNLAAAAATSPYQRLLILVELKGGNDGLNTVVPYTDPGYYALRPRLAIRREDRYSEIRTAATALPGSARIEMSYIGG